MNRRAVEIDPLSVVAHLSMGMHAYYAGQLNAAADAYQKALAISPDDPEAHYLLGLVYLERSQPQQGLSEFQKDQPSSERRAGEALAYFALGDSTEADAALHQLIADHHDQAAYQIAEVYAFRGEPSRIRMAGDGAYPPRCRTPRDPGRPAAQESTSPILNSSRSSARSACRSGFRASSWILARCGHQLFGESGSARFAHKISAKRLRFLNRLHRAATRADRFQTAAEYPDL